MFQDPINYSSFKGVSQVQYIFTAVFSKEPDGTISASFPDLPGFKAYGDNMVDAMKHAERALGICLFDMEQQSIPIPDTRFPDELEIKKGDVAAIVLADTDIYHQNFANKNTSYNVNLPEWLLLLAADVDLESSKVFRNALKREIGLPVYGVKPVTEDLPVPYDATKIMSAVSDSGEHAASCSPVEEITAMFYIPEKAEGTPPFIPIEIPGSFEIPTSITPVPDLKEPTYVAANSNTDTTSLTAPIARLQSEVETETKTETSQIEADITSTKTDLSTLDKSLDAVSLPEEEHEHDKQGATSSVSKKALDPRFGLAVAALLLFVALFGGAIAFVITQTDLLNPPDNGSISNPAAPSQIPSQEANSNYGGTKGSNLNGYPIYRSTNGTENSNIAALRDSYGNNDIIAILTIGGTSIENQTIMQRDNDFYRNHDINLNPSEHGWPYLCIWRNAENFNNLVIHGSGTPGGQFYDLATFISPNIFAQNPAIIIETPYATYHGEVFSFYTDTGNFDFRLESDWPAWIQGYASRTMHPSDVNVNENDSIITLVAYVGNGMRNILHARLVR